MIFPSMHSIDHNSIHGAQEKQQMSTIITMHSKNNVTPTMSEQQQQQSGSDSYRTISNYASGLLFSRQLEKSTGARFDNLPIPRGGKPNTTVEQYLKYHYDKICEGTEIDPEHQVIFENIFHHLSVSPMSFQGASSLRIPLITKLFGGSISRVETLLPKDWVPAEQQSEISIVNGFLSSDKTSDRRNIDHLLRCYIFLQYLRSKEVLLILNRATSKLQKIQKSEKPQSAKELSARKALAYINNDRKDANLLLFFLRNGASENTESPLKQQAKDQLYRLDVWLDQWEKRKLYIAYNHRFSFSKLSKVGIAIKQTILRKKTKRPNIQRQHVAFYDNTRFNQVAGSLSPIPKIYENNEVPLVETSDWYRMWYSVFCDLHPLTGENTPGMQEWYKGRQSERDEQWSQGIHDLEFAEIDEGKSVVIKEGSLFPLTSHKNLLKKLAETQGGISLKEIQGRDYMIDAKVEEFIEQVNKKVEEDEKERTLVYVKNENNYLLLEKSLDVAKSIESKTSGTKEEYKSPMVLLSYLQVVILKWLYKDVYLAKSRTNTRSLSDSQLHYLESVFTQRSNVISISKEKSEPYITDLASTKKEIVRNGDERSSIDSSDQFIEEY